MRRNFIGPPNSPPPKNFKRLIVSRITAAAASEQNNVTLNSNEPFSTKNFVPLK